MQRKPLAHAETAERERDAPRESDDDTTPQYEPGMGEDEHGEAPGASSQPHEPAVGLDDPRVSPVPETTPDPDESEAQAASRLRRPGGPDALGGPEDQPDHARNEVYLQQDKTRP